MTDVPELKNRATIGSGQEINSRLSRLSGVTVAPTVVIVLLNRRRKRPIRRRLENNLMEGGGCSFLFRRGGAEVRGGRQQEGQTEGGACVGVEGKQDVLGLAFTFFLFLRVAVALIFDKAGAD